MTASNNEKIGMNFFYNSQIPIDWEVKRIDNFGIVYTGNTPPTNDSNNYGN
jgi:hypothetical protein